jgi:hypothetical protein
VQQLARPGVLVGSMRGVSTAGAPPTALSAFAISIMCSISSTKTLRTTSASSRLASSRIE